MVVDEVAVEFPAEAGGCGEGDVAVGEFGAVGDHLPPDGVAVGVEAFDVGGVRLAREQVRPGIAQLKIELKYVDGEPVIREISRVSKPGRRVYSKIGDLPRIYNGLGISILSTPRGVLSDNEARAAKVGGEVLCRVF